jgi:hypothetical protein
MTLIRIDKLQKQMNHLSTLMYWIYRHFDNNNTELNNISEYTRQLHEGFSTLQVAYKKVYGEKHMPDPQEAQQIENSIRDLLAIEIILSQDMKIANRESVNRIIYSTIRTYPNINEEYLTKKTISVITQFIKDNQ